MFLRTNDKWITRALAIPNTFVDIEKIRPDLLMVRTMSRLLVEFDQIGRTAEWVESQIPEIVRKYAKLLLQNDEKNSWWDDYIDMNTVAQVRFLMSVQFSRRFSTPQPDASSRWASSTVRRGTKK